MLIVNKALSKVTATFSSDLNRFHTAIHSGRPNDENKGNP